MTTYLNSENAAKSLLSNLTSKFPVVSWDKIGFDKTRNEFMGSCFRSAELAQGNDASATFTLIQTYNEQFKKVWRVTYSKL